MSQGKVTGDICHWLCDKNPNYTLIGFYEGGSKKVLKINRNGEIIILKMHHSFIKNYDALNLNVENDEFTNKV